MIQAQTPSRSSASFGGTVSSTTVFLTMSDLLYLQSTPVNKDFRSRPSRLARTIHSLYQIFVILAEDSECLLLSTLQFPLDSLQRSSSSEDPPIQDVI